MRLGRFAPWFLLLGTLVSPNVSIAADAPALPKVADGWTIELFKAAPEIAYPTAIVADRKGNLYLGQDPMDMPGPPTRPIDSILKIQPDGTTTVFAEKLWAVMGLEWLGDTLYVVHAPFLSAFRDTNHDGKADERIDLVTGLGPKIPGFSGINDHVASGIRLGMDGFLYISVGDKGIPRAVGKDGKVIQLFGGGVVRVRPDGSELEVVSTGERNPLSVALSAQDDVFSYGNDDDSKTWPNSLTHHVVGGHYGYPYDFVRFPTRALPIISGQIGGSGTQAICDNEGFLPAEYQGNLFVCDWGLQTVFRIVLKKKGSSFEIASKTSFVTKGGVGDFRPFSIGLGGSDGSLYLVDWAFNGWLADGPKTGRLYRLTCKDAVKAPTLPDGPMSIAALIAMLDSPSLTRRLNAQNTLVSSQGAKAIGPLIERLKTPAPLPGRLHALWAVDALNDPLGRAAMREALGDPLAEVRIQAARSVGIRRDREALAATVKLLKDSDPTVRRETAIALGKLGETSAVPALLAALGDPDVFAAWSIRRAIRTLNAWDASALTAALLNPKTQDDALKLCDEAWASPVVEALNRAIPTMKPDDARAKAVATLAGLYRQYPRWSGNWFGTNPLAGAFPQKTEAWDPATMTRVQAGLTAALRDPIPAVRLQAIAGLLPVGRGAAPSLRALLATETDPKNLATLAQGLGLLGDFASAQALGAIALDGRQPEAVRSAAIDALGMLRGPQALTARISIVYDPKAPAVLVARALPSLGRDGIIPPNDLAGFLDHADPTVRAAALRALIGKKSLPAEVRAAILARVDDPSPEVQTAAFDVVAALGLREAIPRLLVAAQKDASRSEATLALSALPDPLALPVYLAGLSDRSPEVRRASESALLTIRDAVRADLEALAKKGKITGQAATALERIVTRFVPLNDWKVIGPFARTTGPVFVGETSIDFTRSYSGAEGRPLKWSTRKAEATTGRVVVDDFKGGAGDRGGFGYDLNGSPDLCAFGYTEIASDRDREALMLVGSSGSVAVTINERQVFGYDNFAGRGYRPDSDLVRIALKAGKNRILVKSRQGVGVWSFGLQISESSTVVSAQPAGPIGAESLRAFALKHDGDVRNGEAIFFDAKGVGCVKCHAANGRGTANIGPDLTGLALKYDRAEIIRSVLEPSNRIATGYQPVVIALRDGKVINGLLRSENDAQIELVDSEAKTLIVPKAEIDERKIGAVSVMPTALTDSMSVVEFADLISYLQSLKSAPRKP